MSLCRDTRVLTVDTVNGLNESRGEHEVTVVCTLTAGHMEDPAGADSHTDGEWHWQVSDLGMAVWKEPLWK